MFAKRNELPRNQTTLEQKSDRELIITRTFNAPPRIVFDAWTRAELVRRWWAPKSHCVEVVGCEAEVRVGGKYRYALKTPDGHQVVFYGVYQEITPPSRLVYTQIFDAYPDAAVIVTINFEDRGEQTHLVSHELYPSAEAEGLR